MFNSLKPVHITNMKDETIRDKKIIAKIDIGFVDDNGDVGFVARDNWFTWREYKGKVYFDIRSQSYPDTNPKARINPKTNKAYDKVPFTWHPTVGKGGYLGSYADGKSSAYRDLCERIFKLINDNSQGKVDQIIKAAIGNSGQAQPATQGSATSSTFDTGDII